MGFKDNLVLIFYGQWTKSFCSNPDLTDLAGTAHNIDNFILNRLFTCFNNQWSNFNFNC